MTLAYILTLLILAGLRGWCFSVDRLSTPLYVIVKRERIFSYTLLLAFILWSLLAFKYHAELVALIPYCR